MIDILKQMTKDELINFIITQPYYTIRPPRKSSILFARYDAMAKKQMDLSRNHIESGKKLNMKKRDEYARMFHETKDVNRRIELIKKMEPYDKKWQKYLDEGLSIMAGDAKVDRLYREYEIQLKKEEADRQ
jgi:hypothetical protein